MKTQQFTSSVAPGKVYEVRLCAADKDPATGKEAIRPANEHDVETFWALYLLGPDGLSEWVADDELSNLIVSYSLVPRHDYQAYWQLTLFDATGQQRDSYKLGPCSQADAEKQAEAAVLERRWDDYTLRLTGAPN